MVSILETVALLLEEAKRVFINRFFKWIFDRVVSFIGLLFLWPIFLVVTNLIKIKMPGDPAFFIQKRVVKGGIFLIIASSEQ